MPVSISRPTALPASVAPPSTENIIINQPGRFTIDLSNILFDQMAEGAKKKIAIAGKREIVGASDLVFCETSQKTDGTVSANDQLTETLDSTTYPDRVIISVKNERGYNVYLTRMALHGKPITIARGSSGSLLLDSLKRDDDIRRNGENVKVISNDYIFDAVQVPTIADYWYKKCGAKKHLYSLQVHGSALWYEPGDWYTLSLGGAGTNEYISATVEIVSVSVQRTAGGIGSTSLLVRECMESWSKTTLYTARLVTGASPKRRANQSNTLIVASSSFDGTYDYRCDGTDDDVQIQAAINYLSTTFGGGKIQLTSGVYVTSSQINIFSSIVIVGVGSSTIIQAGGHTAFRYSGENVYIGHMSIDHNGGVPTYSIQDENISGVLGHNTLIDLHIKGIVPNPGTTTVVVLSNYGPGTTISQCTIDDITATTGDTSIVAISGFEGCYMNRIGTLTSYGAGVAYGIRTSKKCSNNNVVSATTAKYYLSYADSGTSNACADNANGGFNS
jgi:hypothetical protein